MFWDKKTTTKKQGYSLVEIRDPGIMNIKNRPTRTREIWDIRKNLWDMGFEDLQMRTLSVS